MAVPKKKTSKARRDKKTFQRVGKLTAPYDGKDALIAVSSISATVYAAIADITTVREIIKKKKLMKRPQLFAVFGVIRSFAVFAGKQVILWNIRRRATGGLPII